MIRRILILLAALALGLSGLSASAEDAFEETKLFRFAGTKIPPPFPLWASGHITG